MGAPLIKGGGPGRKRKKKKKTEELLPFGRRQVKKERKVFPTHLHLHTNQNSSLSPHIFPISSTPTIKKRKEKKKKNLSSSHHTLKRKEARVVIRKPQL